MLYPDENKTWKWVLQWHSRGRSVHADLRLQIDKDRLEGYTLNVIKAINRQPTSFTDAESQIKKVLPAAIKLMLDPNRKIVTETKKLEPMEWEAIDRATFPVGSVGATKNLPGYMGIIDKGTVEFGVRKPHFFEYFLKGSKLNGRLVFRQLPNVWKKQSLESGELSKTGKGYTVWMSFFADPDPYVLGSRAKREKWYPPFGISALPKKIRSQIPKEYKYWEITTSSSKKHRVRDDLIDAIRKKEVVLKYAEEFQEPQKKKVPTISKVQTPSSSVLKKLKEILFYKPYPELRFKWVLTKNEKWVCPDCAFLSKQTFTPHTLPTYPNEGKVQCRGYDKCELYVYFPDGKHYQLLPVKNKQLYKNKFVQKILTEEYGKKTPKDLPTTLWGYIVDALRANWENIRALFAAFINMKPIDKWFNVIEIGQTEIKDWAVARRQASKEYWGQKFSSMSADEIESIILGRQVRSFIKAAIAPYFLPLHLYMFDEHDKMIHAITLRLLHTGQALEVEEQLGILEDLMLEGVTSVGLMVIPRFFYRTLGKNIAKQGLRAHNKVVSSKLVQESVKALANFRTLKSTGKVFETLKRVNTLSQKLKLLGAGATQFILDEIGYFVSFWKDAVLIGTTGVPIRNIADNTLKTANEMLNSIFTKDRFWGFFIGENKLVYMPKKVTATGFGLDAAGRKALKQMEGFGINWWNKWRERLYEGMFTIPENFARKGLYAGKLKAYEKKFFKELVSNQISHKELEEMAIKEVNRVFFDYSKKLAAEIPLQNISPFIHYNALNFNYWLKDFMHHPWKLRVLKVVWDHWKDISGSFVPFRIIGNIFKYLIPGIKFNPLSWVSAYKFIQLFVMYKGDPEWLKASDRHVKKIVEISKATTPKQRVKIWGKTEAKDQEDFIERMKYKWVKAGVDTFDQWIGILPVWKKILAELGFAEKEEWRSVFPQSQLIKAAMDHVDVKMRNKLMNDIKRERPPEKGQIDTIIRLLKVQHKIAERKPGKDSPFIGARINAKVKEMLSKMSEGDLEIRKEKMKEESLKAKEIRKMKEMDQAIFKGMEKDGKYIVEPLAVEIAIEIYYWWQLKKTLLGYFTGMWLSKRWNEIYKAHKAILEMLESKE